MIPEIGQFALILALLLALTQGVLPIIGAAREVLAKHDENYMPPEAAEALKRAGSMRGQTTVVRDVAVVGTTAGAATNASTDATPGASPGVGAVVGAGVRK